MNRSSQPLSRRSAVAGGDCGCHSLRIAQKGKTRPVMIHRFKISVYGISLAVVLCAVPAYAQKNTCTTEQLQLPSARECMRLLDQDLVNQKNNSHMLVCSISGIRCCVTDGKGGYRDCGPLLDTS